MKQPLKATVPDGQDCPAYPMFLFVPGVLLIFTLAIGYAATLLKQIDFAIVLWLVSVLLLAPTAGICSFMGFVLSERIPGKGRRRLHALAHLVILALSAFLIVDMISKMQA